VASMAFFTIRCRKKPEKQTESGAIRACYSSIRACYSSIRGCYSSIWACYSLIRNYFTPLLKERDFWVIIVWVL
jgi:hypothetical protein